MDIVTTAEHTIHRFDIEEGMYTSSGENVQTADFPSYYSASIAYNGDVICHGDAPGTYTNKVHKFDFHVDYPTCTVIHDALELLQQEKIVPVFTSKSLYVYLWRAWWYLLIFIRYVEI